MCLPTSHRRQIILFSALEEFFVEQEKRVKASEARIIDLERRIFNLEVESTNFDRKDRFNDTR